VYSAVGDAAAGVGSLWQAARLLRQHRELWWLCALPFALTVALFVLAAVLFFGFALEPVAEALSVIRVDDPASWYGWLWVGPLRALAWLTRGLLTVLFFVLVYFLFTVLGGVLAAPFLDALSLRVEVIQGGGAAAQGPSVLASALLAIREGARRALFFVAVAVGFAVLSLVPVVGLLAVAGGVVFSALFLALDYTGYSLDRRQISFRERRSWLWRHRGSMLAFGGTALASHAIPGLNFVCLPLLVTAGTLLALRVGLPSAPAAGPLRS
jgi:CysZ protein